VIPDFVISDTHLMHRRIVEYEPMRAAWGSDAISMTEHMIDAWQRTVQPHQVVLHLGDFAFGNLAQITEMRARLPGRVILVLGNHDRSAKAMKSCGFDIVTTMHEFYVDDGSLLHRDGCGVWMCDQRTGDTYPCSCGVALNPQPAYAGRLVTCRHDPADFTDVDVANADMLLHGHLHSGNHRKDTSTSVRSKAICCSVEALNSPRPVRLGEVLQRRLATTLNDTPVPPT